MKCSRGTTSRQALLDALLERSQDVTGTPQPDLPNDASDDAQLLWASLHGRIIFTHNIRDFIAKTEKYPQHHGILLAHRKSFSLSQLIELLDCALRETKDEDWIGQVRWLSDWS